MTSRHATTPDVSGFGARSRVLTERVDTFGAADDGGFVWHGSGRHMGAWGVAAVLALPRGSADLEGARAAQRWLATLAVAGGADPAHVVALGAIPFDRHAPAALIVPRLLVAEAGPHCWATLVAPLPDASDDGLARALEEGAARRAGPGGADTSGTARIEDATSEAERYTKSVRTALDAIGRAEIDKVVLARTADVVGRTPFSLAQAVRRLADQEPACTAFAAPAETGTFVGASPELLIERRGREVHSTPLAGTAGRSGDHRDDERQAAALLASAKDRREHGPVVAAIRASLAPHCTSLSVPDEPVLARLASVIHLATDIRGTLADPAPGVLELLADLHPTPAVGGSPRDAALSLISRLEPEGRGQWAGAVGYADAAGDGSWVISIRSALLEEHRSRLMAGAGIVRGSDPDTELAETTVKLRPVLQALYPDADELLDALR